VRIAGPDTEWQRQRSSLNHDWLKNVYLPALDTWLNILEGVVEDPEFGEGFVNGRLRDWPRNRPLLDSLLNSFEESMSPQVLLNHEPLSKLGIKTKTWLGPLVHSLWRLRFKTQELLDETTARIRLCDERYSHLIRVVEDQGQTDTVRLAPYREEFSEFANACRALARSLSKFPNRIEVL
jgi:hypothetical protein